MYYSIPLLLALIQLFLLILLLKPFHTTGALNEDKNGNEFHRSVLTSAGKILGITKQTKWGNVIKYFGVPYAEIPTNTKRFLPSEPLLGQDSSFNKVSNPSTHKLTRSPPACIQPIHLSDFSHPSIPTGGVQTSEDCLKLNVIQPWKMARNELLPVMVFIPGNGYSFADAVQYDGSAMAAVGNIIVVTVNYRVGK